MTVTTFIRQSFRELAHRTDNGLEVTLFWHPVTDEMKVCVCDWRLGAYFEIQPSPHQALDVFYHPYSYSSVSTAHYEDERLAA